MCGAFVHVWTHRALQQPNTAVSGPGSSLRHDNPPPSAAVAGMHGDTLMIHVATMQAHPFRKAWLRNIRATVRVQINLAVCSLRTTTNTILDIDFAFYWNTTSTNFSTLRTNFFLLISEHRRDTTITSTLHPSNNDFSSHWSTCGRSLFGSLHPCPRYRAESPRIEP